MRDFTILLKQDVEHIIDVVGSAFHIQEASDKVSLRFDGGEKITREKTQGAVVGQFKRVELLSSVDQVVNISIGNGLSIDGRSHLVSANISTTIAPSDEVENPGDVVAGAVAVLAIAANSTRQEVELCLPSTAQNPVRIGNASVSANSGSILEPGCSKFYNTDAALYVVRTVTDETVTVFGLRKA